MNEDNSYEQLAEVFLSLKDEHTEQEIYCLCSRVVIKGNYLGEVENSKESSAGPESSGQFFSSSTESPPLQKIVLKKDSHEEAVSCYCSASHCSTDEHDSIREPHSDSGADVSESSRDLEWEKYWATHGEKIVWDAWLAQYSDYIDPSFNKEFESEETLFAVDSNTTGNHKTTFSGCLDSIKETNESSSAESAEAAANGEANDDAPLRLSFSSESSKLSISVGTTTDSLTNVTRVTVSSSDFSLDESSRSGLSSDSSSCDQQWQQLWAEHVDKQYKLSYHNFVARHFYTNLHAAREEVLEHTEALYNQQECIEDLIGLDTSNPYIQLEEASSLSLPTVKISKASPKSHKKAKTSHRKSIPALKSPGKREQSVGYLLQSLRSISLEEGENLVMSSSDDDPPTEQDARRPPPQLPASPVHSPPKWPLTDNMDRAKGAFTLMGLTFAPGDEGTIKTAQVVYKKRNIRSHNRALRFNPPRDPRDHTSSRQALIFKVKKFLDESEVGSFSAEEDNLPPPIDHDFFSEKDDSESDRYYSAEESTPLRERQQKRKRLKRRKTPNSLPKEIADDMGLVKYWCQRYRLFSRFDQGIRLDSESWYSVTPEKVAAHIAERCRCDTIIDAFCGAGGNTIQFAFTCERVIAIDLDASKVELAKHNARIYGVDDRIEFIVGDFFALAPHLKADVVFLSPPWGGPDYGSQKTYSLDRLLPNGGSHLYNIAKEISPNLSLYLPKNVNTSELIELAGPGGFVEVEQNFLDKKLVAVSAYYGELVGGASDPS